MLIRSALLVAVLQWPVVTCAADTEEVAGVSVIIKQGRFEHVLRELEKQAAVANYSCKRYYDDYERDIAARAKDATFIGMNVIRCFHASPSSGTVWVNVSAPPNEVKAVLYGVEGSQEKLMQGREFLERFANSLQKDPGVERACVLAPAEHACKPAAARPDH
jgi:hypothetical protein